MEEEEPPGLGSSWASREKRVRASTSPAALPPAPVALRDGGRALSQQQSRGLPVRWVVAGER